MKFDIEETEEDNTEENEQDFEQENKKKKQIFKFDKKNLFIYIGIGAVIFLIILIIILSSVSSKNKQKKVKVKEPVVIKKEEPKSKINVINENSNERPVAIVSNGNIGNVKPAGLQDSYINYEIITEYGTTKILSIYKDKKVGIVGPIVNLKSYLIDYAIEHDAILTYFGSDENIENEISELKVSNVNGKKTTSPFARDKTLESPNDIFTSTTKIRTFAGDNNKSITSETWQVFNYSDTEVSLNNIEKEKLISAERIEIDYSQSEKREYDYDSSNKYYLRKNNGVGTLDRVTNNQLHYKNIIIMKIEMQDNNGIHIPKTVGSGNGYYITNGYAVPISWSKQARNSKTKYTYADGTELKLNDGNTFIQIVPTSNKVIIEKEN